jgi:outer membrane protein OmpA-like peptidoglycan-associated protein
MSRVSLVAVLVASSLLSNIGWATKKYVRDQIAPINSRVSELNDLTAKNSRDIKDVDGKAQQGIQAANQADQKAETAGASADQANQKVAHVATGLNGLQGTVENLDNYKSVSSTTIRFAVNKATLTKADEQVLDEFAQQIAGQKHYIVQVQSFTDTTGPADYNFQLSRRRADAVTQYLSAKFKVPPYRIYVIGLGKDNPAAQNTTTAGRAENRRVDVQLLTNSLESRAVLRFTFFLLLDAVAGLHAGYLCAHSITVAQSSNGSCCG